MPKVLEGSQGDGRFLKVEEPLYCLPKHLWIISFWIIQDIVLKSGVWGGSRGSGAWLVGTLSNRGSRLQRARGCSFQSIVPAP